MFIEEEYRQKKYLHSWCERYVVEKNIIDRAYAIGKKIVKVNNTTVVKK